MRRKLHSPMPVKSALERAEGLQDRRTDAETVRHIERTWDGPMANSQTTRIRFAIWDALQFAAALASGPSRKRITAALRGDQSLFDASGHTKRTGVLPLLDFNGHDQRHAQGSTVRETGESRSSGVQKRRAKQVPA